MGNWWDIFPVTQAFGGNALGSTEQGTDFGTPLDTSITAPFGGVVTAAGYHPWGGEVDVQTSVPGFPSIKDETFLHLDQISVSPGQSLAAFGQVGLSGGQNIGGSHVTSPQFSNGPHTELDFFTGTPFASTSVNPQDVLPNVGGAPSITTMSTGPNYPGTSVSILDPLGIFSSAPAGRSPAQAVGDFFGNIGNDVGGFLQSQAIAAFVAVIVLIVLFMA